MTQGIPPLIYNQEIKEPSPSFRRMSSFITAKKVYVSSCCGCCSVKTGVIIIGILSIICSLVTIIWWAVKSAAFVAMFVTPIVHFLCGILMLFGVRDRRSDFISPMLSIFFVDLVMTIPTFAVLNIEIGIVSQQPAGYHVGALIIIGLFFGLGTYFFIVVRTFYEELQMEKCAVVRTDENITVQCTGVSTPQQE